VQNLYNLAHRTDDEFIHDHAAQGIAYVPFFPTRQVRGGPAGGWFAGMHAYQLTMWNHSAGS
jgi:hypothetical protein